MATRVRPRRPPAGPPALNPLIRDESMPIAFGDTRYTVDLDQETVDALEQGICPEKLSNQMHDLLRWRRAAIRATTTRRVVDDGE